MTNEEQEQLVQAVLQEVQAILSDVRKEYRDSTVKGGPDTYLETFFLTRIIERIQKRQKEGSDSVKSKLD